MVSVMRPGFLHKAAYLPEAGPASAHFAAEAGLILKQEVAARLRGVMNDRYFGPQGLAAAPRRDMGWEGRGTREREEAWRFKLSTWEST